MANIVLQLATRDVSVYVQWVRWMIGAEEGPWGPGSAMRAADRLYAQESQAIRRVAKELWRVTSPYLWGGKNTTEVYRGLRHTRDDLDGKLLPFDPVWGSLPSVSYSEDIRVACYFADPGKKGMPAIHPKTHQALLPPHGYVLTLRVDGRDVLFHWRWLIAVNVFGITDPVNQVPDVIGQKEVTVKNSMSLIQRCAAWQKVCGGYVTHRYGPGGWEAGDPDPFGEGWVG